MVRRMGSAVLAATMIASISAVPGAAAGTAIDHFSDDAHHEVSTVYYPDDICGPRSGWTTYDVTWHVRVTASDTGYHVTYVETGTYATDFDDPALQDSSSQFTETLHVNITPGGVSVATDVQHDFPGTIRIRARLVFVERGGVVHVDRDILEVSGCP